ncbi:MAG: Asp-tRNA(Asn)/Glu-tRNA(Gln) amidotransferase subunit GatB [Nitrosopumilales archaeon]|nr:Asp-tRNA(Asn)/Glu-tRNA(Gln) amidotransferase subunit GatB [Nitrosopumilales archaeon]
MTKIGLEIHCQLTKLESKLFCSCKADYRGFEPNTNICPVCVGLPGSLPRLNKKAIEKATVIAMALNCQTPQKIAFFRKNYFYPDLPKNFQITQLNIYGPTSIGQEGKISVEGKEIQIRRIQLEEDPGRLIYEGSSERTQITLVDYNRAGTPLVEIVTEPDFENPKQVRLFLNILSDLLENLGVSDPSLEGAMRADANVSIEGGSKVEIKNINSFYDLEKALHFELTRQQSLAERKIEIIQETRHWDDKRKITISARSKEEEEDYRYFLEGDIPWVKIDSKTVERLKEGMPESISSKKIRYENYGIPTQVADILSSEKYFSDFFQKYLDYSNLVINKKLGVPNNFNEIEEFDKKYHSFAKEGANIITTDLMGLLDNKEKRNASKLTAEHLSDLVNAILENKITRHSSKTVLQTMVKTGKPISEIISEFALEQVSDDAILSTMIDEVIKEESKAVEEAKLNPEAINYLVGKVMKKTKGQADPTLTLNLLKKKIS